MSGRDKFVLGLTLLAVVVVPGLANAVLGRLGHPTVGTVVWAVGYGSGALMVWYVWIRPLDISGPEGVGHDEE